MEGRVTDIERNLRETAARQADMAKTMVAMKASIAEIQNRLHSRSMNPSHTSDTSHQEPKLRKEHGDRSSNTRHHCLCDKQSPSQSLTDSQSESRTTSQSQGSQSQITRHCSQSRYRSHASNASHRESHLHHTRRSASPEDSEERRHRRKPGDRTFSSPSSSHSSSQSSSHQSYLRSSHQTISTDISSHSRKTRLRGESSSSPNDSHSLLSSSKAVSRNSANSKTEKLPLFYEDEAYKWIERMERYFRVQAIAERFKVDMAAKAMGDAADGWFQWWDFHKREDSWEALKEDLIRDFPPRHRQKTGKTAKSESSRSSPVFSLSGLMSSQVSQPAKELHQSINKTEMEPTEVVTKKMNKKDETEEQGQITQWPENSCIDTQSLSLGKKQADQLCDREVQNKSSDDEAVLSLISPVFVLKGSKGLTKFDISTDAHEDKGRDTIITVEEGPTASAESIKVPHLATQIHEMEQGGNAREGNKIEIIKSIVYGGLAELITSLSIVSYAAASDTSTLISHKGSLTWMKVMSGSRLVMNDKDLETAIYNQELTVGRPSSTMITAILKTRVEEGLSVSYISKDHKDYYPVVSSAIVHLNGIGYLYLCLLMPFMSSLSNEISQELKEEEVGRYNKEFAFSTVSVSEHRNQEKLQKNEEIILDREYGKVTEPKEDSLSAAEVKNRKMKFQVVKLQIQDSVRYWEGRGIRMKMKLKVAAVSYQPP